MGITSKDIQMYLWVFIEFSMRLCFDFVKENPLPSFVFSVLFLLYVFCSSVFWLLIYSVPLLLISFLILRALYFSEFHKSSESENRDTSRKIGFAEDEDKKKCFGRAKSVRRRKSKKDFPPYIEEEGAVFPFSDDERKVFDKRALTEEENYMKDIKEVEIHSVVSDHHHKECSSSDVVNVPQVFSKDWRKCFRGKDGEDEEDDEISDEEEMGRNNSKGVKPSELSEAERNKRLESLMARRRARRLVSIHVRRTLMNIGSDDPPISVVIPRTNSGTGGGLLSPTPGSAPSVLLPNHNPFDLPYDQHEEKPNLRGGSFHQDFMVPHQEFMFCRHESFSLGPSYTRDFASDLPPRHRGFKSSEKCRSITLYGKDDGDRVIEQVPVEEPEDLSSTSNAKEQASIDGEEDGNEVQIKSVLIEDIDDRTSSSSSSEEDEAFYRIDKDTILKSLSTPSAAASRNMAMESFENGPSKARIEEHFFYANGAALPTPSHSIASDLQVEVSEIGSPPRSVDGGSSFEDEINREIEKDEHESRSREVLEVTDRDLADVQFSIPDVNVPPERVIQQYSLDSQSSGTSLGNEDEDPSAPIGENEIMELIKRNSHEKNSAELAEAGDIQADLEAPFPPKPEVDQRVNELEIEHTIPVEREDVAEVTRDVESESESGISAENVANRALVASSSSMSPKSPLKFSTNFASDTENQRYGYDDPESVVGQISTSSSSCSSLSSSPKSISQTKLSVSLSFSNLGEDKQAELHQLRNQIAEILIHQTTNEISNPTTSREPEKLSADPIDNQSLTDNYNVIDTNQKEIQNKDSIEDYDETSTSSHEKSSVIPEVISTVDSVKDSDPEPEMTTNQSESYDHKNSEETSGDNHTNASAIQEIHNSDFVEENEGPLELEVKPEVKPEADNIVERENLSDMLEDETKNPNPNIVDEANDKAQESVGNNNEGESQVSELVYPRKVEEDEGESRLSSEGSSKDHDSKDDEKPMNSGNDADEHKANNQSDIDTGEMEHRNSDTNLKD